MNPTFDLDAYLKRQPSNPVAVCIRGRIFIGTIPDYQAPTVQDLEKAPLSGDWRSIYKVGK